MRRPPTRSAISHLRWVGPTCASPVLPSSPTRALHTSPLQHHETGPDQASHTGTSDLYKSAFKLGV